MNEVFPIHAECDVQVIAHEGTDGNCQTSRLEDGSWPATCTCGECTLAAEVEPDPVLCVASTFTGSENPLSEVGMWTNAFVGGLKKVASVVQAQNLTVFSYAAYTGRTWANDQSAKITRGTEGVTTGTRVGAAVRLANLGVSDLYGYVFIAFESSFYVLVKLEIGGTQTELLSYAIVPDVTDVIKLTVVGDTLTPELNGTPLTPVVDTTYTSGAPGLYVAMDAETDAVISWEGCEVE